MPAHNLSRLHRFPTTLCLLEHCIPTMKSILSSVLAGKFALFRKVLPNDPWLQQRSYPQINTGYGKRSPDHTEELVCRLLAETCLMGRSPLRLSVCDIRLCFYLCSLLLLIKNIGIMRYIGDSGVWHCYFLFYSFALPNMWIVFG